MASPYSVTNSKHATTVTTAADKITFTAPHNALAVTNHDAATILYFTIIESALLTPTTAVSQADNTFCVRPGTTKTIKPFTGRTISIVGSATAYSAEVW